MKVEVNTGYIGGSMSKSLLITDSKKIALRIYTNHRTYIDLISDMD